MAKLYFYYSAMNAGKSTTLLQASFNYAERGMNTLLFTAAIDTRYGEGIITSRIGIKADAHIFDEKTHLLNEIRREKVQRDIHCVLIDEAQFLTKAQVFQLAEVADSLNIPVVAYGLRSDFQAELFPGSRYLLALADELHELKTICPCGKKASMNLRIDAHGKAVIFGEQTEIGGNDSYVALCRRHFMERIAESRRAEGLEPNPFIDD